MAERSEYSVCLSEIIMFFMACSEIGWSEARKISMADGCCVSEEERVNETV